MLKLKSLAVLALVAAMVFAGCASIDASFLFYVVVNPEEGELFIQKMAVLAKEDGLEVADAEAVSRTGSVLKVLEGRGRRLSLWVQSMPLSGHEDPALCGVHPGLSADPSQFVVFTAPSFFGSKTAATKLGEQVLSQVQKAGFQVLRKPAICGAAALHNRSEAIQRGERNTETQPQ